MPGSLDRLGSQVMQRRIVLESQVKFCPDCGKRVFYRAFGINGMPRPHHVTKQRRHGHYLAHNKLHECKKKEKKLG